MLVGDTPTPRAEGHSTLTCAGETFLPGVPVPSSRPFLVPQSRRARKRLNDIPHCAQLPGRESRAVRGAG